MTVRIFASILLTGSLVTEGRAWLVPIDKCGGRAGVMIAPIDPCPQNGHDSSRPKRAMVVPEAV
jgi:hypothetical protein